MLHVTNGDAVVQMLERTELGGRFLPWQDVLHEGPVPARLSREELAGVREDFLASCGWGTVETLRGMFVRRDDKLAAAVGKEPIVLWFEHDLYDQLQIIQVLDLVASRSEADRDVSMICIDAFPGRPDFCGLGELSVPELLSLWPNRRNVKDAAYRVARAAWTAFRSDDPRAIERVLAAGTEALPFLAGALRRLLQEYPSTRHGLSRTDAQILRAVAEGHERPTELFNRSATGMEEAPFMGDATLWLHVERLCTCDPPLLAVREGETWTRPRWLGPPDRAFLSQELRITATGASVLDGNRDAVALHGIDRWLGGVHLRGADSAWRWDEDNGALVAGSSG